MFLLFFFLSLLPFPLLLAQSSSSSSSSQSLSFSLSTGDVTLTIPTTRPGQQPSVFTTVLPGVFNVTYTITPTTTSTPTPTTSPTTSSSPSPTPDPFDTRVDPAFAVLGVILILTGLPSAFWGHKNRWTSFFLIGFYTLSLVCIVLILKFGVIPAINPPTQTLRGMFVLASSIAGIAGGAVAIFFWKGARYGIGAWGGFALGLWIQCFHNGGVIKSVGFRWILYIGCAVAGFALSTIPKIHYHVLLISTAFVGATSFMLGVDCFTTAGLKEFYVWNLGFPALFPKFTENHIQFPVSQTMQIELGLIGAVSLMGIAVQLRILKVLQKKMQEIAEETQKRDEEAELRAADRLATVDQERDAWEKDHPTLTKHGRQDSTMSSLPLMKEREDSASPIPDPRSSYLLDEPRPRHASGLSDFKVAPTPEDDLRRAARNSNQPVGSMLPNLDLGTRIQEDVPSSFIADDVMARPVQVSASELEDFKRKQELLAEIQTIRRSIDILKSETPIPSSSEASRRPSFASKRTLSLDATNVLQQQPSSHARPPREAAPPRARVHSMELSSLVNSPNDPITRPTSVPLKDSDWDSYIQERKLLQPPAGITPPIVTNRVPMAPAVQEALQRRKRRESALGVAAPSTDSSEDVPLARVIQQKPSNQLGPVTILPPRRASANIISPVPQLAANTRTRTFEELTERHREKLRDMQAPLTQAEREHAELEAARQRWDRSKALEKEAVTRRQAEKVAALEKRKKMEGGGGEHSRRSSGEAGRRHSRSLSADKLGNQGGTSSRRLSAMKVEDWQRYQQDAEMGVKTERGGVPFPQETRRKSRDA
uniref:TM7S3/TM198-like domain-containing protein n=1 Tax=Psilocybe cubensis TaxID=181762 RepID=A0A8H8CQJ7_PSICU